MPSEAQRQWCSPCCPFPSKQQSLGEEIDSTILQKYDIVSKLGRGAYGIVWKAVDKKSRQVVAVKKCFDAFQNSTDAQRTCREIMYLQELHGHTNIIKLLNVLKADNDKDIYLITDCMETDLHTAIRENVLEEVHKQYIICQVLRALKYMHSGQLVHRDIKPRNILLDSDCLVKLCDFGLARSLYHEDAGPAPIPLTDYVASRWYRPPEILLGSTSYTQGVDMWSVGCILGEIVAGKAIFPGTSTVDQLDRIMQVTGYPTQTDIDSMTSASLVGTMFQSLPILPTTVKPRPLSEMFPAASAQALDFMRLCLLFSPSARITAKGALQHSFVAQFRNPEEEIDCQHVIQIPIDDNTRLELDDYREQIFKGVLRKKKEQRRSQQQTLLQQQKQVPGASLGAQTRHRPAG